MTGSIAWFAKNRVAANLLAALIIAGGALSITKVRQEFFPEFSLDLITVSVEYLGAAPEEVEQGVNTRIEEAIQGLDGVEEVSSVATEGRGVVTVELVDGADTRKVLDDVKSRVDAIDTFPVETEKPIIRELTNRRQVIDLAIYGDVDERTLRNLTEKVREDLIALPEITVVELLTARPFEISIEVSEESLRRHGLTLGQVANAVRRSSLDLPGGAVKTEGGEVLLRTKGQAYSGHEFADLVLITREDGTHLRLGEVATIVDGFAETDQAARFEGQPALLISVFRVGEQDALGIADAVMAYADDAASWLPAGINLTFWNDQSKLLRGRRDLLVKNGLTGLVLVFLSLAIFLRFRLAYWVAVGLFIAFMGTFWLMPALDVSINMISLFAFILVLGIVVDDAIVVGENIYTHQHRTEEGLHGSIAGAREVSLPVVFAVMTTVAAFLPLLGVSGVMGKIMRVIPLVVITCLLWSLVESMWVLPAHLSHYRKKTTPPRDGLSWRRIQGKVASRLEWFIDRVYRPSLEIALRWRYATVAIGLSTLLLTAGLVGGEFVRFIFFPEVETDFVSAAVTMPPGTPIERTSEAVRQLERGANQLQEELRKETGEDLFVYMVAALGEHPYRRATQFNSPESQMRTVFSNLGELTIELSPSEVRSIGSSEISARWRELTGPIPEAIEVSFTDSAFSAGEDINVRLSGRDMSGLRSAADALKARLAEFTGVYEITDSFREGKEELKLAIEPQAEVVGLTLADLGRQVRQAFYGEEAQRIQRGRHDVRVMVRYPEAQRRSLADLENMRIRTPQGWEVPFGEVARVAPGRGFASIRRVDGRRAVSVTADVDSAQATPGRIIGELEATVLPEILADHPGISYAFEGQQAEQGKTINGLKRGFALALVMIFGLLAIPLRSYAQPVLIMTAIPFGFVGAVWGHMILGLDLTILSMFGLVALAGVVVNDSLVMVDFINRNLRGGRPLDEALREAAILRFRPILLTSLTTFVGLSPLMLEKSMQARFLIPMAVSLAFGVIFATFITLVLLPAGYRIMEDIKRLPGRLRGQSTKDESAERPRPVSPPEIGAPAARASQPR